MRFLASPKYFYQIRRIESVSSDLIGFDERLFTINLQIRAKYFLQILNKNVASHLVQWSERQQIRHSKS